MKRDRYDHLSQRMISLTGFRVTGLDFSQTLKPSYMAGWPVRASRIDDLLRTSGQYIEHFTYAHAPIGWKCSLESGEFYLRTGTMACLIEVPCRTLRPENLQQATFRDDYNPSDLVF